MTSQYPDECKVHVFYPPSLCEEAKKLWASDPGVVVHEIKPIPLVGEEEKVQ